MSEHHLSIEAVLAKLDRPLPAWARPLAVSGIVAGALGFLILLLGDNAPRAWRAYHLNWLYWTGLAQAGVLFSAVTTVAKGRWAAPVRRIAEASVAFLPISFALFLVLWLGRAEIFPWIRHPITDVPGKSFWLRDWFLFLRDGAGLLLLYGLSFWFVYHSLRPDAATLQGHAPARVRGLYAWLARGWDPAQGHGRSHELRERIAPGLVLAYAVVMSLIAFDCVMSLAPYWLSNLLGAFFFMGAWLSGLMSLALLALFWRRHLGLEHLITTTHLHDLGKLGFGFTVFWGYLFFSQFLVIWYGNLPEETSFMFLRMARPEWRGISAAMVLLCFLIPFWGLLFRKPKQTPALLATMATISLLGIWVDRYVFTVPSLVQAAPDLPLGWPELVVTAGFFGLWALAYQWFAVRFPIVSPALLEHEAERRRHPHASFDAPPPPEV
jgi:hypothetical protein